jgi:hypothetical protein
MHTTGSTQQNRQQRRDDGSPSWSVQSRPGPADDVCNDNCCPDLVGPRSIGQTSVTVADDADGADATPAFVVIRSVGPHPVTTVVIDGPRFGRPNRSGKSPFQLPPMLRVLTQTLPLASGALNCPTGSGAIGMPPCFAGE